MSLFITSLNSGSNGNAYYIGNERDAILVDAGISCREIEKRMKRLGLAMQKLRAVFISHEHADHINGIAVLSKKYRLPVYITPATLLNSGLDLERQLVCGFADQVAVTIGSMNITPLSKKHDAVDPFSFTVTYEEVTVGVFTDIGTPCQNVIRHFQHCNAAFLEANYDEKMLTDGNYPFHLKKRISGGSGHLSNSESLELFMKHRPVQMSHLILSHLSKNNNTPQLVADLFARHAGLTEIIIASRYAETPVVEIRDISNHRTPKKSELTRTTQLAFSFS